MARKYRPKDKQQRRCRHCGRTRTLLVHEKCDACAWAAINSNGWGWGTSARLLKRNRVF